MFQIKSQNINQAVPFKKRSAIIDLSNVGRKERMQYEKQSI